MLSRLPALLLVLFVAACGDDGQNLPTFIDSGTADAQSTADAEACTMTMCGDLCVDTETDPLNCGGCDLACDSPGQICSGSLPCECPPDFIPASVGGGFDQIFEQMGALIGFSPLLGTPFNAFVVVYDEDLVVGMEYDLSDAPTTMAPPAVAAGYDVNITNMTAHTAYGGLTGTIVFDTVCADGASGTISNVTFTEVAGVFNPTPAANGCSMSYETISFDLGNCAPIADAGPLPDAVVPDAGI